MPTIFHAGRKLLRQHIPNHSYAEIADFLYFRTHKSKYLDENGKRFFLLPNIDYIVDELGFKKRTCEKALSILEKTGFIKKSKTKCYDGAVRLQIFVADKLKNIMAAIDNLKDSKLETNKSTQNTFKPICDIDSAPVADSDSAEFAESYIKENKVKEDNNYNYNQELEVIEESTSSEVKSVNFVFSFDLDKYNEDVENYVSDLATKHSLDGSLLFSSLVELQESNIYKNQDDLVNDAINLLKHQKDDRVIAKGDDRRKYKKAIFEAGDSRGQRLSSVQHVAVVQTLRWLKETGKSCISDVKEVFSWVEFQITNPDHHFKGKGFKHCLYIIKKMLCNSGKSQYSKPLGFGV